MSRMSLFLLPSHSLQACGICVAPLNDETALILQLLLNFAWHDLDF